MSSNSIVLFLFFFVASLAAIWAATLEGTVFDPSGRAVPGVRVSPKRSLIAVKARCAQDAGFSHRIAHGVEIHVRDEIRFS